MLPVYESIVCRQFLAGEREKICRKDAAGRNVGEERRLQFL